jgi:O-antigen/teichoic acid export membrane protein
MNESTASIARNARAMMLSQIVTWCASFAFMAFLPRYLGATDFGRLYFAITASTIGFLLTDLGLTTLTVKEVARDRSKASNLFINAAVLRVAAWAVSLVVTVLFVQLSGYPSHTVQLVFVLCVANLFWGLYDLIHRVFVGFERMEYRSITLIIEKVFLAAVGVTMLLLGYGSLTIAAVILASMAVNFAFSFHFLRKTVALHPAIQPSTWMPLLRRGFPFMISAMLGFIYYRINVMMLSSMTNEAVVGWYGAPFRLFDTLMFFPSILNTAVYPVLSRLFHSSKESMMQTSRKVFDITVLFAMPMAVGMASLAGPIISLLFGLREYSNSVIVLQILSASLVLVYVDFVLNTVLISHDKERKTVVISIIATITNVTVGYFAIRYFQTAFGNGAIGAVITTAVTELCVMSMNIYLLPPGFFDKQSLLLAGKALASGLAMFGVVMLLRLESVHWIISGGVGCAAYVAMLFALKAISKREVRHLLSLLPFRKSNTASVMSS